jgi:hypothetical protein
MSPALAKLHTEARHSRSNARIADSRHEVFDRRLNSLSPKLFP